jgi:hypothetical protein
MYLRLGFLMLQSGVSLNLKGEALSWLASATQIQIRLKTVKPKKAQQGRRSPGKMR